MKSFFTICLFILTGILSTKTSHAQATNFQDSLALVDIYNSTNGNNWTNNSGWLQGPVTNWFGVTLTATRVGGLALGGNNLVGTIPFTIGNLTSLTNLNLSFNRLTGGIPTALSNLQNSLIQLNLSNNQFSGTIPSGFVNLINLNAFDLSANQLTGPIPAGFENLHGLISFKLDSNKFDFTGMEAIAQNFASLLVYSPQFPKLHLNFSVPNNLLSISAGGTVANNTYHWFNNGVSVANKTGDSTFNPSGCGKFWVTITNSLATQLTLSSDTFSIGVVPAITIAGTANNICAGTPVSFTATVSNGGTVPAYQWRLNGQPTGNNTPTYISGLLANNDVVSCILTSSDPCANPTKDTSNQIVMLVRPVVIASFAPIGPFCQNSIASVLPATSLEGITGTWNPSTINTATVGTTGYIFTPTAGQCAKTDTINITITAQVTPTFNAIGPLCQNSVAPALPASSKEGISGTWNPAVISTVTAGTTNYIFTPTTGATCAVPATLSVTITTQVTPTFNAIGPLCQNSVAPALPATSKEGISGIWNPAAISTVTAGTTNYIFTPTTGGACAVPATLNVTITTQVTPTFNAIGPLCQNSVAPALPAISKEGISGTWNPAAISTVTAGTTNYIFTPTTGATCAVPATLSVTITTQVTPTFNAIGPLCQNSVAPALPATSKEGISGTWNPAVINTSIVGTTNYIFTPTTGGACSVPATLSVTISARVTPTFNGIGPLCQNSVAPALPAISKEGISGTWNPAVINTSIVGTTNYIFTPTTGGACTVPATLSVTISPLVVPTFNGIGPLCQNSVAPALPAISKEGISGTWNPVAISTVIAGTTNYIFTPTTGGACAVPATLSVTISARVTPTFNGIGPLCQNATAPALPATSKEGISGTWNPAVINTATAGTTNYIFTPTTGGACAVPATLSITITAQVTPTFNGIGPLCQNATAPALPATSMEGISGTWNPAAISTATAGTTNYIFTPTTGGVCVVPATLSVTISARITPTFNGIGPLCQNSVAPALPPTSREGISGTWNPTAISTATAGTTNYIFTPTTVGVCAVPATLSVTISPLVAPTFNGIGPLCQNTTAPALPAISKEGISGTWNPAVINTSTVGTTNYIFTPTTGGACVVSSTLSVTISTQVTPTFNGIGPLCQNSAAPALPVTSKEGISGTWNPAVINTLIVGATNYIFTPATGGACVVPSTLSVTISTRVAPTFNGIGPFCQNTTAPALPATSKEGINGTWNPAVINTATAGTTNYIFTPTTGGACAVPATLSVTITAQVAPTFNGIGPLCQNSAAPALPPTSKEGISGTWNPATINTATIGTTNYIFTPTIGSACAVPTTVGITITKQVTPTFNGIGPLCQNSTAPALPVTSKEGISGTWNPSTINTATIGTTNYIFTPTTSGACAVPSTLGVTITAQVAPTFNGIGPLCQNATAPVLPATSKEGISGTWNPAAINTSIVGTTNYIFTPTTGGACSVPATLSVTINAQVAPTFNGIGPLCQNSVAPALPATSKEGISGTWNPAVINTSTVGTTNYIFTPTTGSACSVPATVSITISKQVAPTFNGIGPLCQNSTAPALPVTSKEGISGTWNPATINTATIGTTNYIFTPTNSGTCFVPATLSVTISTEVTPTFNAIGPLCQSAASPQLPATSKEGINGTWSPVTVSTSATGSTVYTFTPSTGQCAIAASLTIDVNPLPVVNLGPDKTISAGGNVGLVALITGVSPDDISTYLWSPAAGLSSTSISNPVANPVTTTTYRLDVSSVAGCEGNGSVTVNVLRTNVPQILIPNAFSPNGDGINDTWIITNLSYYPGATLEVFNRYGQMLLHSEGNGKPWDGTYHGNPLPMATYYYILDLKNNTKKMAGSVTIFR